MSKCTNPATYRFTWPGKDENYVCTLDAIRLLNVSNALGMYLQLIPLAPDEMVNKSCCQDRPEKTGAPHVD